MNAFGSIPFDSKVPPLSPPFRTVVQAGTTGRGGKGQSAKDRGRRAATTITRAEAHTVK